MLALLCVSTGWQLAPHAPVLSVRHNGVVTRKVERQEPGPGLSCGSFMSCTTGLLGSQAQRSGGKAVHLILVGDQLLVGLGVCVVVVEEERAGGALSEQPKEAEERTGQ